MAENNKKSLSTDSPGNSGLVVSNSYKSDPYLPNQYIDEMSLIVDSRSYELTKKWITAPLPEVGPRNSSILGIATASDGTSMPPLCKSSVNASWNQLSGAFVGAYTTHTNVKVPSSSDNIRDEQSPIILRYSDHLAEYSIYLRSKKNQMNPLDYRMLVKDVENDRHVITSDLIQYIPQPPSDDSFDLMDDPSTSADSAPEPNQVVAEVCNKIEEISKDLKNLTVDADPTCSLGKAKSWFIPVSTIFQSSAFRKPRNPEFTPAFLSYVNKLMEANASTALMATVRGVSIRDNASITSIAKTLASTTQEYRDVAPLLKTLLLLDSLSDKMRVENCFLRYMRRTRTSHNTESGLPNDINFKISITPWANVTIDACFVPLDMAVAILLNSPTKFVPCWGNSEIDTDVIMVPIRTQMIGSSALLLYIAVYLSSNLWNGTVSHTFSVSGTAGMKIDQTAPLFISSLVPASNSVYIPGQNKVYLVLIDESSSGMPGYITVNNTQVPIFNGSRLCAPVSLAAAWKSYWQTSNIECINRDLIKVFRELCSYNSVLDTCGLSLSLAAELSNITYPGVSIDAEMSNQSYDKSLANGCWTFCDTDDTQKTVTEALQGTGIGGRTIKITEDYTNDAAVYKPLTGFNFSAMSPWGFERTSLVTNSVQFVNYVQKPYVYPVCSWLQQIPDIVNVAYKCPMSSSIARIGVFLGFVDLSKDHYEFSTPEAIPCFMKMLSTAVAPTINHFLLSNNISLRMWSGWEVDKNAVLDMLVMRSVPDVTLGLKMYQNMNHIKDSLSSKGAYNWISEYYDIKPESANWRSHFPIGCNLLQQWENKMDISPPNMTFSEETSYFETGNYAVGVRLRGNMLSYNAYVPSTSDWVNYNTMTFCRPIGAQSQVILPWLETYPYITRSFDSTVNPNLNKYLYSNNLSISTIHTTGITSQVNEYLVKSAKISNHNYKLRVSPLMWPDPITARDFLGKAVDYVLIPAAMGGLGMLTGGPVGAAAGAGSALVGQIAHDMHMSEQNKAIDQLQNQKNQLIGALEAASTVGQEHQTKEQELISHTNPNHPNISE